MARARWALLALLLVLVANGDAEQRASGTMPAHLYLWQRRHDVAVSDAVEEAARESDRIIVLAAEIGADGSVTEIDIGAALAGHRLGLAIRIGSWRGDADRVADLARALLDRHRAAGLRIEEIQLDHDAPTGGLALYARLIARVRERLRGDVALTITALPAWLDSDELPALLSQTDGYVLQVHSLEPPRDERDPIVLCDPTNARIWVERAARLGIPFRVALPSYGYLLAFAEDGRFLGLGAEQDLPELAPGTRTRELMADASSMAALVAGWTADRPRALVGVAWFRMPVAGDHLSWAWPTLRKAMRGEPTSADLAIEVRGIDVVVVNRGTASAPAATRIEAVASGAILSADGIGAYAVETIEGRRVIFTTPRPPEVRAGEEMIVGWMRDDEDISSL